MLYSHQDVITLEKRNEHTHIDLVSVLVFDLLPRAGGSVHTYALLVCMKTTFVSDLNTTTTGAY